MGSVNNEPTAAKTKRHVAEAIERGASVVVGGKRAPQDGSGLFFEATVLDGLTGDMEIAREETFGPVMPVSSIRSEEEALEVVNGRRTGCSPRSSHAIFAEGSGSRRPSGPGGAT